MPTRYAQQPQWRQRRQAIEKKGFVEAEMLMESELSMPVKSAIPAPASPMSIASLFDVEIKPIVMPGAWTVVGKGGKAIKPENKMYDPPKCAKKKKNRTRTRKAGFDQDARLEVLASSSTSCAQKLQDFCAHDDKAMRGRDAKGWKRYREAKKLQALARGLLIEALAVDDDADEPRADAAPALLKKRSNKSDSKTAKARRKARFAARDARCYSLETEDEHLHVPSTQLNAQKTLPMAKTRKEKASTNSDNKRKGDGEAASAASRPRNLDKQQRKATNKKCSFM